MTTTSPALTSPWLGLDRDQVRALSDLCFQHGVHPCDDRTVWAIRRSDVFRRQTDLEAARRALMDSIEELAVKLAPVLERIEPAARWVDHQLARLRMRRNRREDPCT